jgi:nucleotide-binding universal stress UspA family protein
MQRVPSRVKTQAILPIVTYPDANSDAVAANAVAVAAHLGADLHAVALHADIPEVSNPFSGLPLRLPELRLPELIREADALSRSRGDALLAKVGKEAAERSVNLTTDVLSSAFALLGEAAAAEVRYFDVALLGWEAGNPTSKAIAEAVLFGSGRPAMLLPELSTVRQIDHIAVAWDGSRVAARAVADAAVLLERSSRVSVITVADEKPLKEEDNAERLAAGLRKRGLVAEGYSIDAEDCPIGVSIQEHAIERGAQLVVMGGYGHSRVRDFVLGGATKDVLNDLRIPILLSH